MTEVSPGAAMTYRPHLDGIRAIAVLAVVLYHAHVPGFPGGFVGVDVFFVISGYLITGLLQREFERTSDISIMRFVERRIRRLAPALFVVLLATLLAGLVWLSPIGGEQQGLAKSAIATVLLSANHYFWLHTGGYFDAPTESYPLLHTWTLSVEEQFYLVWPWLILAFGAWARLRGLTSLRASLHLLLVVFASSLAACVWFTNEHQQATFFLMPFRAWEFAAGGAVFELLRLKRPRPFASESIAILGLTAVLASVFVLSNAMAFPGWIAMLPVLGSAALIYGSEANPQGSVARLLSLRPMVTVGLISYSLYLWHWPVLTIARIALIGDLSVGRSLVLCLASTVLAWLTYRYIEQPIRTRRLPLMASQPRTFVAGATMMSVLVLTALGIGLWAKVIWTRQPGNAAIAARFAAIRKPEWDCQPTGQVRGKDGADRGCLIGPAGDVKILLWGDSHAGQLGPVLKALATARGVSSLLRYAPACPPALGFKPFVSDRQNQDCLSFNRDVLADFRERGTVDTVILSAHWMGYMGNAAHMQELTESLSRTISELQSANVHIVLMAPGVDFHYEVPACLVRRGEADCGLTRSEAQSERAPAMLVIDSIVRKYPGVVLVDPLDYMCTKDKCPIRRGQDVAYSDSHHLSIAGAKQLIPAFLATQRR
jgi:peptidoglycan/LPS O-acetylase OafA/YrhL